MKEQPTVVCIMLVNGREEMVRRAIKSFREQTYENKLLFCLDTGKEEVPIMNAFGIYSKRAPGFAIDRLSVGKLRNLLNGLAVNVSDAPILAHWDSDDWSHPNRIAEQVALLESSKKQCVGYRDLLFWKTCSHCNEGRGNTLPHCPYCGLKYDPSRETPVGEAWLYSNPATNYCLGTSLCYWRSVWEQRPFLDLPKAKGGTGEDVEFLSGLDSLGVLSIGSPVVSEAHPPDEDVPRMIASIHGSNTQYYGGDLLEQSTSWRRVSEWDQYCRERMAL